MIDRDWIAAHIPHQGSMCLLDSVQDWDAQQLRAQTSSHRQANHPLRAAGRLGMANVIEYAAQAMALHAALLAGDAPRAQAGFLASARDVHWQPVTLDTLPTPLTIHVERLSGTDSHALYAFSLLADAQRIAHGRLSAVLNAAALPGGAPTPQPVAHHSP